MMVAGIPKALPPPTATASLKLMYRNGNMAESTNAPVLFMAATIAKPIPLISDNRSSTLKTLAAMSFAGPTLCQNWFMSIRKNPSDTRRVDG